MPKVKLHLGCGKRYLEGFCHVDMAVYKHIDFHADIGNLWTIESRIADLIYVSHAIDYFDKAEIVSVFKGWRRILKKGGVLRVAVPDFAALTKVYAMNGDINLISGPICGKWKIRGTHETIYHKMIYDYNSLVAVFKAAGFKKIQRWDWREVFKDYPDYDDYSQAYYPHMDKENGILISLNVEAEK